MGDLTHMLGMLITRDMSARTMSINQLQYLVDMLDKHGMADFSPSVLPMDPSFLATVDTVTLVPLTGTSLEAYIVLLGSLQYAAVFSRTSISTAFSIFGAAESDPSELHLHALKKSYATSKALYKDV
jgi:hypothetical protein